MKLLEDDEDESMHSGADVEALSAALNRDIGGDSSTFSQPSESEAAVVVPEASSSASQQLLEQWQPSSQDGNIGQDVQPKEEQPCPQLEQDSSQESAQQVSDAKNQEPQNGAEPKNDQPQLQPEHPQSDQQLQPEKGSPPSMEKGQVKAPDQMSLQFPNQESATPHSEGHQQNIYQQLNAEQQTTAANEANNAAKRMRGSPSIPFQLLIPIIRPHLDKDRAMQLQSVFSKLRTNEVSKEDFLRVIRNIVGDQMLRQAVNKVHIQLQTQAAKNQQASPNQYALQNQAPQQKVLPRGAHQYPDPRAFSSINPMSSSQSQKGLRSPAPQPVPPSTVQMQMDAIFPPVEKNGQNSQETENSSSGKGAHASQMPSTSKNIGSAEKEVPLNSLQGINKQQQHLQRPQTSFPMYGGSSGNFHPPFARPPISAATTSFRSQTQDSHMRPSAHAQGMASMQPVSAQPGNAVNMPKYESQNIGNEAKRLHGGPLTSHSTSPLLPVSWHTMANKEQRSTSLASMPYVKQEAVDQVSGPPNKSQSTPLDGSSFGSGHVGQGNPALESLNNEGTDKQSSRMGFPTSLNTMGSQATMADPTVQAPSPIVAGTSAKALSKKPSVGQKKPLEAVTNSAAGPSKKQKTSGVFHDQSIEHLNDVTAVSGVNLREEEEQLLAAPKEDSRTSEATRRAVQEEEERLILQKGPLQKKLADIMFKSGLQRISGDVQRCLSLCVEERLRGVVSSLIRLSKQRVDVEKSRHRFIVTSDVHRHILEVNKKAKEEWDKKQAEEVEKLRKANESEGNIGSDLDKDKDEGRTKTTKVNKEEDDKMRTTAANVAARAAVGGDDMLSRWQNMFEKRQKREALDGSSPSQPLGKATNSRSSPGFKRNSREQQETQKRGSSSSGGNRKFGRSPTASSHSKVAHSISRKDVIAVLEREPQMSKSTLIYRLYEKSLGDSAAE